jgi:cell division protein FtsB
MENIIAMGVGLMVVILAWLWVVSPLLIAGYVVFKRLCKEIAALKAEIFALKKGEAIANIELVVHDEPTIPEAPRASAVS